MHRRGGRRYGVGGPLAVTQASSAAVVRQVELLESEALLLVLCAGVDELLAREVDDEREALVVDVELTEAADVGLPLPPSALSTVRSTMPLGVGGGPSSPCRLGDCGGAGALPAPLSTGPRPPGPPAPARASPTAIAATATHPHAQRGMRPSIPATTAKADPPASTTLKG